VHIVENPMLNGETIRLDGAIRMAPREVLLVVPDKRAKRARSGTHTPRRFLFKKVSATMPQRYNTAYGSLLSQGRRVGKDVSINQSDTP
jgi:hypothetical protein